MFKSQYIQLKSFEMNILWDYKYINNLWYKYHNIKNAENEVMRVWFLRIFVICGFLCLLKMLVVLKNLSSKHVDL